MDSGRAVVPEQLSTGCDPKRVLWWTRGSVDCRGGMKEGAQGGHTKDPLRLTVTTCSSNSMGLRGRRDFSTAVN